MVILKLLLSVIIIALCTYLGISKSKKLYDREYILREYVSFLSSIENEIKYTLNILPNAIEICRLRLNTCLKDSLGNIAFDMLEGDNIDKSISENIGNIDSLSNYDKSVMINTLRNLGRSNTDSQISIIESGITVIEDQIKEASQIKNKNSRMYRTVGMASGIVIAILFV